MTVGWIRSSFSDLDYDIKEEIVEGHKVVVRLKSRGRHTGEFIGFPPTGGKFSVEEIHIYRIAVGKIIEHWSSREELRYQFRVLESQVRNACAVTCGQSVRFTAGPEGMDLIVGLQSRSIAADHHTSPLQQLGGITPPAG